MEKNRKIKVPKNKIIRIPGEKGVKKETFKFLSIPTIRCRETEFGIFIPIGLWPWQVGRSLWQKSAMQFGYAKFFPNSKLVDIETVSTMGEYVRMINKLAYNMFPCHLEQTLNSGGFFMDGNFFIPGVFTNKLGDMEFHQLSNPEEKSEFLQGL
mgnify:CR=1 FL=1